MKVRAWWEETSLHRNRGAGAPGTGTPTGTAAFADSYGPIAGCEAAQLSVTSPDTATCTTQLTHAGSDEVTATYSSDAKLRDSSGATTEIADEQPAITSASSTSFTRTPKELHSDSHGHATGGDYRERRAATA